LDSPRPYGECTGPTLPVGPGAKHAMLESRIVNTSIRYARAADGVSIAYWSLGAGPALVVMPTLMSHIEFEWQTRRRHLYEHLSEDHQLVRFDGRGRGLSDRNPLDVSIDAQLLDLEAVTEAMGLHEFALLAQSHAGPVAIEFAKRHPDAVTGLILFHSYARASDHFDSPQVQALEPLREKDWMLYTMTSAHARMGWSRPDDARDSAALLRASLSPEMHRQLTDIYSEVDVSESLQGIRAPTLVLHRKDFELVSPTASTFMASRIPFARFALVKGSSNSIHLDEDDEALVEVQAFLRSVMPMSSDKLAYPNKTNRSAELTDREIETLRLLAQGRHNKEIAHALGLSIHTVERHIANAYAKIDAHSRAEAAGYAIRNGLMPSDNPL
jgi:pimeloyl-ACP methyl ester carboxylesterase/DNA-binding CsgD family transcriptional regulator